MGPRPMVIKALSFDLPGDPSIRQASFCYSTDFWQIVAGFLHGARRDVEWKRILRYARSNAFRIDNNFGTFVEIYILESLLRG